MSLVRETFQNRLLLSEDENQLLQIKLEGFKPKKAKAALKDISRKFHLVSAEPDALFNTECVVLYRSDQDGVEVEWLEWFGSFQMSIKSHTTDSNPFVLAILDYLDIKYIQRLGSKKPNNI